MNNLLLTNLNLCNIDFSKMNVQECWNFIENVIINTVDKLAPIKMYPVNPPRKNPNIPCSIKQKINKRNRLLIPSHVTYLDGYHKYSYSSIILFF